MNRVGACVSLCVLVSLASCSPYRFGKPIERFAGGVADVEQAITSAAAAVRTDEAALQRAEVTGRMQRMRLEGCEGSRDPRADEKALKALPRCRLVYAAPQTPEREQVLAAREQGLRGATGTEERAMHGAEVLKSYANALAALTNAKDREALDAASNDLAASLTAAAGFANAAAPGASVVVGAAAKGVLWLVGQALDAERRARLEWAVKEMDPLLPRLTTPMEASLTGLRSLDLSLSRARADVLASGLSATTPRDVGAARFAEASEATARHDALRGTPPGAALTKLLDAHAALAKAIDDPQANFVDFVGKVGDFASQAKKLRTVVKTRKAA